MTHRREPVSERLDRLSGLLATRQSWTAPQLASELGVCLRTVRRDLARLEARGVPLEAEPGRGGGVRLPGGAGLGRLQLDAHELLDLLLALAIAERLKSPLLLSSLRGLRQKVAMAFPAEERRRLDGLRRRILHGPASSRIAASWQPPRSAVLRPVQQAFFELRALEVTYLAGTERTVRVVEPQYLLSSWPAWYLLVWDHLRDAPRTLRLDRLEAARVLELPFRVRPADSLRAELTGLFTPV